MKEEALLQAHIMQSSRLVFESCLTCTKLPAAIKTSSYNIRSINKFIKQWKPRVLTFYSEVVKSVSIGDVEVPPLTQFKSRSGIPNERNINDLIALRMADYATLINLVFRPAYEDYYEQALFEGSLQKQLQGVFSLGTLNTNRIKDADSRVEAEIAQAKFLEKTFSFKIKWQAITNLESWYIGRLKDPNNSRFLKFFYKYM